METQYLQQEKTFRFSGEVFKHAKLPSGVYGINQDSMGELFLVEKTVSTDNLIKMPR